MNVQLWRDRDCLAVNNFLSVVRALLPYEAVALPSVVMSYFSGAG